MPTDNNKFIRLNKVAKELNVGIHTIVDYLAKKGKKIDSSPNAKVDSESYEMLLKAFHSEKKKKEASKSTAKIKVPVNDVVEVEPSASVAVEDKVDESTFAEDLVIRTATVPEDKEEEVVEPKPEEVEEKKEPKTIVEHEDKRIPGVDGKEIRILGRVNIEDLSSKGPKRKTKEDKDKDKVNRAKEKNREREKQKQFKDKEQKHAEVKEVKKETVDELQQPQPEVVEEKKEPEFIPTKHVRLTGPNITGEKVDLTSFETNRKNVQKSREGEKQGKVKRARIKPSPVNIASNQPKDRFSSEERKENKKRFKNKKEQPKKQEVDSVEIEKQIKETLAKLSPMGKSKTSKHRRDKRQTISMHMQEERQHELEEKKKLKVTEFVTANELATMMDVPVTKIIASCMTLGMFVSINQRLDAEAIQLIADEFGFSIQFVSADVVEAISNEQEEDRPEDLELRAPIVTVMGHVDHGKTSLLDYIRKTNVIAGEAGGITQHIGAYEVRLPESGKKITFLDTPGHEAFTAMRARGAKMTDIAIIVIACDDRIMPQTIEAINHAQAAGVPIVFALNKIDKPGADPDKIKTELANMNLLVEDWGGKIQSQEISAKKGTNVDLLLEKVLLEAEMLDLKGNPKKRALGTVIESSLDKGRGYVAKILVQDGTIRQGDVVLAGSTFGRVKAMYNERNKILQEAGPSTPVLLLGLNGAPQAGDTFNVMPTEKEAKDLAQRRTQLQREQGLRTQKHITLDEIGRRIAIGDFKQLDLIVKADVDGSVEALSDSLLKLSTPEVQVNVIHKSVGQITESDVLLATASNAIIIGFQVRPSVGARKLAEQEQIDIRLYSIIYTAINELKDAIEGMLSPEIQEKVVANLEVKETFKISKVGTIAGCVCLDGKIGRNTNVRIIRDGIVVYTGKLASLKRFKDDVKEVVMGQDCGLNIENFNDIKIGDIIEGYEEITIKRTLKQ